MLVSRETNSGNAGYAIFLKIKVYTATLNVVFSNIQLHSWINIEIHMHNILQQRGTCHVHKYK